LSDDNAAGRIAGFVVAYTVFRAAYCLMAANALEGSDEANRMQSAAKNHRNSLLVHAPAVKAEVS
jgi:hypothetical protein